MLGLADRARVLDLFELIMAGDAAGALNELASQYSDGADPLAVLRDLSEITHWVSVIKITPEAANDPTVSPEERARGQGLAERLPMRALTRMWQMLLKALEEVAAAPNAMMAAEMAVIRLTHVSTLPAPEDLIRRLQDGPGPGTGPGTGPGPAPAGGPGHGSGNGSGNGPGAHAPQGAGPAPAPHVTHQAPRAQAGNGGPATALAAQTEQALARFASFDSVVELIRQNRDVKLLVEVETGLRLVSYQPGRIEFQPTDSAPRDLAARLGQRLQAWTGNRWAVSVTAEGGAPTIAEMRDAERLELERQASEHPLVQAVLTAFPAAKISNVVPFAQIEAEAALEALPEVDDEWDPFEED
jgi:DNA polymerase-3 subunit gamma/tau